MGLIAEETLQQVLAATDIVDLVGRSVKLRRAGGNYVGLCPFHNEKSPSFNVSPSRQSYHCFGCGAGGNAFRFVMNHDGLSFAEAVRRLADAAGIRIQEEAFDPNAEKLAKARAAMLRAHKELAEWYHLLLMRHQCGDAARQYLKSRGMNAEVAKNWQLGFAPGSGEMLWEWAAERQYSESLLLEAGILKPPDAERGRNAPSPRFWNRLMIPIRNDNGEVIGFSGRALNQDAKPKYLNTAETPLFTKSKVLFGFDKSKRAIAKQNSAIVVEGQIDMLTVFEAGFQNVVASQGTAFTELHARMLKRHANEIVLCFDSDSAGYKAAERAFQILTPVGLIIKVAALPKGDDPDSLIRSKGPEAFAALVESAEEFITYQIEYNKATADRRDTSAKVRLIEKVAASIALCENAFTLEPFIHLAAPSLGISEGELKRHVLIASKQNKQFAKSPDAKGPAPVNATATLAGANRNAKMLAQYCIHDAEVLAWLRKTGRMEVLRDVPGTGLLERLWTSQQDLVEPISWAVFLSSLDQEEEAAFSQLQSMPRPPGGLEDAKHALDSLEIERLDTLIQRAQTQLKQPGLASGAMEKLHGQVIAWRKEYLDRRNRSPDTR